MLYDAVVVGTGPNGALVNSLLLNKGLTVLNLDVGSNSSSFPILNSSKELLREYSADTLKANEWFSQSTLTQGKTIYGQDFHQYHRELLDVSYNGVGKVVPSSMLGGYSTVWGGSCLSSNELYDISRHYIPGVNIAECNQVNEFLNVVELSEHINDKSLIGNLQGSIVNADYQVNDVHLATNGSRFPCVDCGLCLMTCPHDFVYCSKYSIQDQQKNANYQLINQVQVISLRLELDNISVQCIDLNDNSRVSFRARRVYLAAGPIATSKIVMNSFKINRRIILKCSDHYALPIFKLPRDLFKNRTSSYYAGPQAVIKDANGAPSNLYLQIYRSNKIAREYVKMHTFTPFLVDLIGKVLDYSLYIAQGYLPSKISSTVELTCRHPSSIEMNLIRERMSEYYVQKFLKKLAIAGHIIGKPIFSAPLLGMHFGACIVKGRSGDVEYQTDQSGQLNFFNNVYICDASNLPDIFPGPITNLSMLNTLYNVRNSIKDLR